MPGPGFCQHDAGVLDASDKLTKAAEDKFIKDVEDALEFGMPAFLCFPELKAVGNINLRDRRKFKDFYETVLPTYENIAVTLNVKGMQPLLPLVFDPIAIPIDLDLPDLPTIPDILLKIPEIIIEIAKPQYTLPKIPTFELPELPIPKVPIPPSLTLEFPSVDLNAYIDFMIAPLKLPDIFLALAIKLMNPTLILDLPQFKLDIICEAIIDSGLFGGMPPQAIIKIISARVLMQKTVECLSTAVVGSILGSSPKGIVGLMGKQYGYIPPAGQSASPTSSGKTILKVKGIENTTPAFKQKLIQICEELNINPDWVAAVMSVESAGTFSPSIKSSYGNSAVGLIQFTSFTAKQIGTTREELINMDAETQLDYVKKYFELHTKDYTLDSFEKVAIAVIFPTVLNKAGNINNVAFTSKNTELYRIWNKNYNKNRVDTVYIRDIVGMYTGRYYGVTERISADE